MFGGTVLHTHAQKTARPCLGASNTCTKDASVAEKASLRSRLSTYELCLCCTGGQIGTREPGCNRRSLVICLRSMMTTQDCARVNGAPIPDVCTIQRQSPAGRPLNSSINAGYTDDLVERQ